ncbi:MAG: sigma-70 family RNA polymerase sigma factor [Clostridia bacterium]|nr:sigma-70 family RNA polymerase sigma factor [Clostridia bacterium]
MRKIVMLTDSVEHLYSFELSMRSTDLNKKEEMTDMLFKALNKMLTPRQLQCIQLYYIEGKRMPEISAMLGINKSTVSRHISTAKHKLTLLNYFV